MGWTKIGLFALGTLFGSAGIKVLSSRDAMSFHSTGWLRNAAGSYFFARFLKLSFNPI